MMADWTTFLLDAEVVEEGAEFVADKLGPVLDTQTFGIPNLKITCSNMNFFAASSIMVGNRRASTHFVI